MNDRVIKVGIIHFLIRGQLGTWEASHRQATLQATLSDENTRVSYD